MKNRKVCFAWVLRHKFDLHFYLLVAERSPWGAARGRLVGFSIHLQVWNVFLGSGIRSRSSLLGTSATDWILTLSINMAFSQVVKIAHSTGGSSPQPCSMAASSFSVNCSTDSYEAGRMSSFSSGRDLGICDESIVGSILIRSSSLARRWPSSRRRVRPVQSSNRLLFSG